MNIRKNILLYKICKINKLHLTLWQYRYIAYNKVDFPHKRGVGKTTAVALKALLEQQPSYKQIIDILKCDPDNTTLTSWYHLITMYTDMLNSCINSGIAYKLPDNISTYKTYLRQLASSLVRT